MMNEKAKKQKAAGGPVVAATGADGAIDIYKLFTLQKQTFERQFNFTPYFLLIVFLWSKQHHNQKDSVF